MSAVPQRWAAALLCALWMGAATAATGVPACRAPASTATGPTYLLASQADMIALLPPPPAADSAAARADLQAVLDAQRSASVLERAHAVADSHASCARFDDVVGPALAAGSNAALLGFLDRAAREGASLIDPVKDYWKRSRPYVDSPLVVALGDVAPGQAGSDEDSATASAPGTVACAGVAAAKPPSALALARQQAERTKKALKRAHASFPSGHAAFGTVCAILLADMLPERRAALFARAADFEHSRLVLGAHFPSDLQAGQLAGTVAAALLMQNARFQHDFEQARARLRAALAQPAQTH